MPAAARAVPFCARSRRTTTYVPAPNAVACWCLVRAPARCAFDVRFS